MSNLRRDPIQKEGYVAVEHRRCEETGKAIYHSATAGRRHCGKRGGRRVRAYRCESCRGWHITTEVGEERFGRRLLE